MKQRPAQNNLEENSSEEVIAALPILRQDVPTITALRTELRWIRRMLVLAFSLGIFGVVALIGGTGLMMALLKLFPALNAQSEQSRTPMDVMILLWFLVTAFSFVGWMGLTAAQPFWINRRMRGREAVFCDTQLIGDLIDTARAIQSTEADFQKSWYAGCVLACLTRTLPEIAALEAMALTDRQRDFLVERALAWQSVQETLVLATLRSAPLWGDIETLAAVLMISDTAGSEAIRTAALASLSPLKTRLLAQGEDSPLINSLFPNPLPPFL